MADLTYKMTVTLTDGTEIDAGNFTAPQGPAGPAGPDGENGRPAIIYTDEVTTPSATRPTVSFSLPLSPFAPTVPKPTDVFIYLVKLSGGVSGIGIGQVTSAGTAMVSCRCKTFVSLTGVKSANISQV